MATKSVSFAVTLVSGECAPLPCTVTKAELVDSLGNGPLGWDDAICHECGESAAWCPDLSRHLPRTWVEAKRSA